MKSLAISLAVFLAALHARATTITAATCNQAGLQSAIAGGTVTFGVNCTIALSSPINIPANGTTHINGNGFAVTFNAGNTHGVINVPAGGSLVLGGVTIENGHTSNSTGGGIANAGLLEVSGCKFVGNTNAILNTGTLSVTNSTFTGNPAPSGGAIIHTGPAKAIITHSTFGASGAGNGGGGTGGAIYISGTSAEIDDSSFSSNIATQGGAIYAFNSTLTLSGDSFTSNSTNPAGTGGAIANIGSNITIKNTSAIGGGFQLNQAVSSSTAGGLGGAIYSAGVLVPECGGGICIFRFEPPSLSVNTVYFANNSSASGGAIYNLGNTLAGCCGGEIFVTNSYFFSNTATGLLKSNTLPQMFIVFPIGAAIDNEGGGQLSVASSTFNANTGFQSIKNAQGALSIINCTLASEFLVGSTNIDSQSVNAFVEYSTFLGGSLVADIEGIGNARIEGTLLEQSGFNDPFCVFHLVDRGYNIDSIDDGCLSAANNSLIKTQSGIAVSSFGMHGGPTPTFLLPATSPAVDKIPDGTLTSPAGTTLTCGVLGTPGAVDQRGVARPQNLRCDIGAIEHLFSNLPGSSTTCDGIYNQTFDGDIQVFPGQNCVFLGGGITGNVLVHGGRFELRYASVGGNVEIFGDSTFSIGPSATISGNLEIHDLPSSAAQNQVCGASITGNLEVHNNAAAVAVGTQDQTLCAGNTIGGILSLHDDSGPTSADGNTVAVDLDDHNNSGPTEVFNNLVQGVLACSQNSTITGSLNSAAQKQGQCAGF